MRGAAMGMMMLGAASLGGFVGGPATAQGQTPCRQALALALDVSGSVDAREYRLQLDGLAAALSDPEVHAALLSGPDAPVSLFVFEWSDAADQRVLVDWVYLADAAVLQRTANQLRAVRRAPAGVSTALGAALATGAHRLAQMDHCWVRTLDVSADGTSNTGPRPQDVTGLAALDEITINALVILPPPGTTSPAQDAKLLAYFDELVIRGSGAFRESARGYDDYARAMKRKLLREIEAMAIGAIQ